MRHLVFIALAVLLLAACGGPQPAPSSSPQRAAEESAATRAGAPSAPASGPEAPGRSNNEFVVRGLENRQGKPQEGLPARQLKPTSTEAAIRFIVVDKDKGPIPGIVVSLTAAAGKKYYTQETNALGHAEVLVPVGQRYEITYLSLGRKDVAANVNVTSDPNQNLTLTLRYKRIDPPKPDAPAPGLVLQGVTFDTGKATIRPESYSQLDGVVEFMTYKKSARIEISGHTDNVGNPKTNKSLSQKRAQACREYLISKGIDGSRVEAVGYGDEKPISSNDTEQGRQDNRRIEAKEL